MFKKFLALRGNESRGARASVSQAAHEFDVESLEDRRMLAVMVNVTGNNNVTITSDSAADAIVVTDVGGVIGVYGTGGAPGATGVAAGTLNNLTINMGGGTDFLVMDGSGVGALQIAGNLNINMGGGNTQDAVLLGSSLLGAPFDQGVDVLGNMHIHTGPGADIVTIDETNVTGNAFVGSGGGTDAVAIGLFSALGAGPLGNNFLGSLTVNAGANQDLVFLNDSLVGNNLVMQAGGDADFMFIGDLFGAVPGFGVTVNGNATIYGGGNDDVIAIDRLNVIGGNLNVYGGGGNDSIAMGAFAAGTVTAAGNIHVFMQAGDDLLVYDRTTAAPLPNNIILNGNSGNDTLIVLPGVPLLNQEQVFSFETVI